MALIPRVSDAIDGVSRPARSHRFGIQLTRFPLWLIPLGISLALLLPIKSLAVTSDGIYYLSIALNLFHGKGYVGLDWTQVERGRQLLPWLVAMAFGLNGPSLTAAFLVTRMFFVLNALTAYALGVTIINRWVGLGASLLVLSSVSINVWSGLIHIDHIVPFFMAVFVLATYVGLVQRKLAFLLLAGLALGLGYMTKETALAVLPLPLMSVVLIPSFRTKPHFKAVFMLYALAAVILVLNLNLSSATAVTQDNAVSTGATILNNRFERFSAASGPANFAPYLSLLPQYFQQYLAPNFGLAPVMVLAWLFTFVRAIYTREQPYVYMTLVGICLSPFVVFQVITGYRDRQSMPVFLLTYPVVANFAYVVGGSCARLVSHAFNRLASPRAQAVVWAMPLCALVLFQVFADNTRQGNLTTFLQNYNSIARAFNWHEQWKVLGIMGAQGNAEVADWLLQNAEPGAHIAGGGDRFRMIYYLTDGKFPTYNLFAQKLEWNMPNPEAFDWYMQNAEVDRVPLPNPATGVYTPILMWTYGHPDQPGFDNAALELIIEEYLLDFLRRKDISYIITTPQLGPLGLYLVQNPSFEEVGEFENGAVQIFKVHDLQPAPVALQISDEAQQLLQTIQKEHPSQYGRLVNSTMRSLFGWPPEIAASLLNPPQTSYLARTTLSFASFAQLLHTASTEDVNSVIERLKLVAQRSPANPWPYLYLGAAYAAREDPTHPDAELHTQIAKNLVRATELGSHDPTLLAEIAVGRSQLRDPALDKGLLDTLIQTYEQYQSQHPGDAPSAAQLAELYIDAGRTAEATDIYLDLGQRTDIDQPTLLTVAGHLRSLREVDAAAAAYAQAIQIGPAPANAYKALADLRLAQDDIPAARAVLEAAAATYPEAAWPRLESGQLLLKLARERVCLALQPDPAQLPIACQ